MALVSPGVQVTIIDESQYLPAPPATVPLIILATATNKVAPDGVTIAPGTLASNANKLYAITSQRDLATTFGLPKFYTSADGASILGYQLNEYGLLAAYSVLGLSNLCYVVRTNINLASLQGSISRPSSPPTDGTYWLNTTTTTWGIFQFSQSTGNFTSITPIVITDATQVNGSTGQPIQSIGNIGDYAVSLVVEYGSPSSYDTYWYKDSLNEWVRLGGSAWRASWPTIQGTTTPGVTAITAGNIVINGVTVAVPVTPNNNLAGVVSAVNSANIPFVTAASVNGRFNLYSSLSTTNIVIGGGSTAGTLSDLGISTGTFYPPALAYGTNAQQPLWRSSDAQPHPTGSVWIKTNSPNAGTNISISRYSALTATYATTAVQLQPSDWYINNTLDTSGGQYIPAGSIYAQYGFDGEDTGAPLQLYKRLATGVSTFTGTVTTPTFANSATFRVTVSQPNSTALLGPYTVTMPASGAVGATDFVTAWTGANIPYTTAAVSPTGAIVLTQTVGGVIILDDSGITSPASAVTAAGFTFNTDPANPNGCVGAKWGPYKTITFTALATTGGGGSGLKLNMSTNGYIPTFTINGAAQAGTYLVGDIITVTGGNPLSDPYQVKVTAVSAGAVSAVQWFANFATPQFSVQLSNWQIFNYTANEIAPVVGPATGTLWYYSTADQVDIMTNVGGVWKGYGTVPYATNGLPTATGSNTTDPNGPIISASEPTTQSDGTPLTYGDLWVNTSNISAYPVLSRWENFGGMDQWVLINNADHTTENGILFADARWAPNGDTDPITDPIPTIKSLLQSNYIDLDAPAADLYPQGTLLWNTRRSGFNVKQYNSNYFNATNFPDQSLPNVSATWLTVSGNATNGAPYMGANAQRAMIVQSLAATIDTTNQLRDERTQFNLIACPFYEEVSSNMVTLNNDRGQTAYIVGDSPMTLPANGQAIQAWATNTAGASQTNAQGLVTRDTYMGIYYPSGVTNDTSGRQVAVPPSHMMLATIIHNDAVAYPWFAPAGQRRGVIQNATNIGYLDAQSGNFIIDQNNQGLRDIEYTNFINPIAAFPNIGLLNYGNKNSFNSASALDRTNVARLVCYLRVQLAAAVQTFLFEPNDSVTQTAARAVCQTLLADVQAKRGIYDFLVVCDSSNNTPARVDRNELWIDIAIEPTKAVEYIYIPVRLLNTGAVASLATNG